MGWRIVSLIAFLAGIVCLALYALHWSGIIYAAAFCFLIAGVTFLVSIFARRGSTVWQGRGKG